MSAHDLPVALQAPIAVAARGVAERRGMTLAAWLNEAVADAVAIQEGLAAVAEWEAEHGSPTPEQIAAADAVLDELGVPRRPR